MTNIISLIITTIMLLGCGTPETKTTEAFTTEKPTINSDSTLKTGWYYIVETNNGFKRKLEQDTLYYFLDPTPIVTAKNIISFEIYTGNSNITGLAMKLDEKGTVAWSEATKKYIGKRLAFIVNNKLVHNPRVNAQITVGITALNRGIYTTSELEKFKEIIEKEK